MTQRLLIVTGGLEAATGAGLLIAPGLVASLLLGAALNESGATLVARICGAALIVVGVACWSMRNHHQGSSARGLMSGLLFYNLVAAALLVYGWIGLGLPDRALASGAGTPGTRHLDIRVPDAQPSANVTSH